LKTRVRISIPKTTACVQRGSSRKSLAAATTPIIKPPKKAPYRLPIPPSTAAVNAIKPPRNPWRYQAVLL
jgi:hypothetical protein